MPNEQEIYARLTEVFHETFMRNDIKLQPDLTAKDVAGWDSLKQVMLIVATEDAFGIQFSTGELDTLQSVGDLARIIMAKAR